MRWSRGARCTSARGRRWTRIARPTSSASGGMSLCSRCWGVPARPDRRPVMIRASFRAAVRRTGARLMQIRAAASGERRFLCELVHELLNGGDAADGSGRPASNDDVRAVYLLESEQRLTAFYGLAERG